MSFGATYGAISLNNVFNSALYRDIYEILLVRLRAPFPSIMSLKYANFAKVVIYSRSTLVAHFDDCFDRVLQNSTRQYPMIILT